MNGFSFADAGARLLFLETVLPWDTWFLGIWDTFGFEGLGFTLLYHLAKKEGRA